MGEAARRAAFINGKPPEERYRLAMREVIANLDRVFNADMKGEQRGTGFILLTFPLRGHGDASNYFSNGVSHEEAVAILEAQARYIERIESPVDMTSGEES